MKRLFANENSQFRPPIDEDGWERASLINTATAKLLAGDGAGGALRTDPTFPYPETYQVSFANAQASTLWVPVNGYALSFWDSTNLTDTVNVVFGRSQGDVGQRLALPFRPGHALGLGDFTWMGLTWSAIAGATGTLVILPRGVLLDENR
jgi:hypothetical protein